LKSAEIEDLEDVLVIWLGQMNAKNGVAISKVTKEHVKVIELQISVINFVHKNWYVCSLLQKIVSY
jgi:hypothetical protein